jgi:hypothetical protein
MSKPTPRFLEFVNLKTGEVGLRCDVTGDSKHNVERCLRGMLINIHPDWFVRDTKDQESGRE